MKALILAALILAPSAIACRCDFSHMDELRKDPKKAALAYSAEVTAIDQEREGVSKVRLKILRRWRGLQGEETAFLDSQKSTCAVGLELAHKYLVLTNKAPNELWNMCSVVALPLDKADGLIRKLDGKKE